MNDANRPPWLDADALPGRPAGARLQALLDRPGIVSVPGAHDVLSGPSPNAPVARRCTCPGRPSAHCTHTDAAAVSLDGAIERARLYQKAGADIIFPEALTSDEDFRRTRRFHRRTLGELLRATHGQ